MTSTNSLWLPRRYSRRHWLGRSGAAFGLLALADLLSAAETPSPAPTSAASPNAVRPPHFPARAKRVIFLYMPGGPSQLDLFDPKPRFSARRSSRNPNSNGRAGRETLEQHVEKISSLPFVDVLYIRCDWRNVQSRPGRLDLDPVWALTLDAARRKGLRVAFRVQLSNTSFQPDEVALPPFLRDRIPLVNIGKIHGKANAQYREPRYDHPEFQKAFRELTDLLAAQFDGNPLIEWVDLMQYGFWGEGHTSNFPNPFPDYVTAERTSLSMTERPAGGVEEDSACGEHSARHQQCG